MAQIELSDEQYARLRAAAVAKGLTPIGWIIAALLEDDARHREQGTSVLSDERRAGLIERLGLERVDSDR